MDSMNTGLVSYRDAFERNAKEALAICRKYSARESKFAQIADEFESFSRSRLADLNPKIMVYGIYNSGKSTLLNALIGEERAKMNDVPTTKAIESYKWKEYTIYDTPGIDAPKKDEEVSKEQLRNSDVIIFVMGTEGNVDYAKNYRELREIVECGKHILLVLNNKSGFILNSGDKTEMEEIAKIKAQVYENFVLACGNAMSAQKLAERFPLCIVDAKMALDARIGHHSDADRQTMLEGSNILDLEAKIIAEYKRTTGKTIIDALQKELSDKLGELRRYLEGIIQNVTAKRGSEDIASIQELQDDLIAKVKDFARSQAHFLQNDIYAIFKDGNTNEAEVRNGIENKGKEFVDKVNERMLHEWKRVCSRIDGITGDFVGFAKGSVGDIQIPQMDISVDANWENSGTGKDNTGRNLAVAGTVALGAAKILPMLMAVPVAGPVLAAVGGVLMGLAAIFGFSKRNSHEDEEYDRMKKEEQRQIALANEKARIDQERRELSERIANEMVDGIMFQLEDKVTELLKPVINAIHDASRRADADSQSIQEDLQKVRAIDETLRRNLAARFAM